MVDFTFVSTWAGTAYTAFVIYVFALRLITGWRTAASHNTDLVLDALVDGSHLPGPAGGEGGRADPPQRRLEAQYLSIRYGAELVAAGIAPSVGSVGDSYL